MKKRLLVLLTTLVAIAFLVYLVNFAVKKPMTTGPVASSPVASSPVVRKSAPPRRELPADMVRQVRNAVRERENLFQSEAKARNAKFFGKVVDEKGQPVAGARIMVSPVQSGASALNSSDAEGRFLLDGIVPSCSVFVSKQGYQTAIAPNGRFHYEASAKNPNFSQPETPAVFTLRRL
jgi:hypothetical protein